MVFRKSGSLSVILAISLLFSSCAANAGIFSFCRRRPLFTVGVFSVAAILVFVFLKAARDVAGEIG